MRQTRKATRLLSLFAAAVFGGGLTGSAVSEEPPALTFASDIATRLRQLPDTRIDYDRSQLDERAKLADIPVDINPVFPAAGEK